MIWLVLLTFSFSASAREVTLAEFLENAWSSASTQAIESGTRDSIGQRISSVRGKYLPHISLEATETDGFPSSNADLHIGGVMGSAYRKGWAAGVVVEQTVYDFGRVASAIEQAKAEGALEEAKFAATKLQFLSSLGSLYLACARTRSLRRLNDRLMQWAGLLFKETEKFAKTGQRSLVDRSLIQSEVLDLELQKSELVGFEDSLHRQMKFYAEDTDCRPLSKTWRMQMPTALQVPEPRTLLAKAQLEISRATTAGARAAMRPVIKLTGSAGDMQDSRLVPEKNYSVGLGLVFPVWNGGEDSHREEALKIESSVRNEELHLTDLDVQRKLLGLREGYSRDQDFLLGLEKNLAQIRKTTDIASQRYQSLEGPLIDVRDSFRQLRTIETQRIEVMNSLAREGLELALLK